MHVSKLSCKDGSNCSIVVGVMREVHENGGGADIGVFFQVSPCKVLILNEDWVVDWRQRVECEGAL